MGVGGFFALQQMIRNSSSQSPRKFDVERSSPMKEAIAKIKVGDRVIIGTGTEWIWRHTTRHWATIERILEYTDEDGKLARRFLVLWDNRIFGIFKKRHWKEDFDIDGIETHGKQ